MARWNPLPEWEPMYPQGQKYMTPVQGLMSWNEKMKLEHVAKPSGANARRKRPPAFDVAMRRTLSDPSFMSKSVARSKADVELDLRSKQLLKDQCSRHTKFSLTLI
eukprot:TRINITY_DN77121_c0_g1_i1.p4 TRINITY_DN77121_c0_g1~~TRINITY_DN77121_c0_g1_i1.p4  ORF type:complete len:106 (+),score=23.73 TRINITY_DN77121_c0_g1_i1:81-398(+)